MDLVDERFCKICGKLKPLSEFYRKGRGYRSECIPCSKIRVTQARKRLKLMAVNYKGGKCCICGYNKCLRALDFHHTDPKKKNFNLSNYSLYGHLLSDKLKKELDQCKLVCANCHRELEEDSF